MSVIIVEEDQPDESTSTEVAEVAKEVAETVAEAIAEAVETIVEQPEPESTGETTAILTGINLAETAQLTERIEQLEATVTTLGIIIDGLNQPPEMIVEEVEQPTEPDEPPSTWKSKLNNFWFGAS